MDPNATLIKMRELASTVLSDPTEDGYGSYAADELAELVLSLDAWLSSGGFFPEDWAPAWAGR